MPAKRESNTKYKKRLEKLGFVFQNYSKTIYFKNPFTKELDIIANEKTRKLALKNAIGSIMYKLPTEKFYKEKDEIKFLEIVKNLN